MIARLLIIPQIDLPINVAGQQQREVLVGNLDFVVLTLVELKLQTCPSAFLQVWAVIHFLCFWVNIISLILVEQICG